MARLLSPAGSEEIAYSAFQNGADAVYVGARSLSRRTSEYEMDDEAIGRCIDYANRRGKEIHLALNIHYQESQLPILLDKVRQYRERGVSLIIVLDLGLIEMIHDRYPDLRLCASVSAGICNASSARLYKELGCSQFVAQLNATPDEVRKIKRHVDIGIEAFCHGNVDFNQCGRCWMSTYVHQEKQLSPDERFYYFLGSLHRGGGCYRICQGEWNLRDGSEQIVREDCFDGAWHWEYRLNRVAGFVRAGVDYFKIQGRTYSREVVAMITRFYREVLDRVLADPAGFEADDSLREELERIEAVRGAQELQYTKDLCDEAGMAEGEEP